MSTMPVVQTVQWVWPLVASLLLFAMRRPLRTAFETLCTTAVAILRAAAWHLFLKRIGVSEAERRRLGIAAAEHDLNPRNHHDAESS